jgi:hypothetical protein
VVQPPPKPSIASREQLAIAIGAMGTQRIRARLASGEMTELGMAVAQEELARREREGELPEPMDMPEPMADLTPLGDFLKTPLGWSWGQWAVVVGFCVLLILPFGVTARNKGDQVFLYAVILIQALALAGIIRTIAAIFFSSSALGALGKLVAIVALGVVLFALTVCSEMARHGWGGG